MPQGIEQVNAYMVGEDAPDGFFAPVRTGWVYAEQIGECRVGGLIQTDENEPGVLPAGTSVFRNGA
eukprot:8289718-Lingulodinium_polyedra.AAC.1